MGRGAIVKARMKFSRLNCPKYMTGPEVLVTDAIMTTTNGKSATKTRPAQKLQMRNVGSGRSFLTSRGLREVMA